jgi:hypothetical protein
MKKGKTSTFLDYLKGNHSAFFFFVMLLLFSVSIGISRWSVRESEKIHARLVRQRIYDFKKDLLRDTVRNFLREIDRMREANRLKAREEMRNIIGEIGHLDRQHPEGLKHGVADILRQGKRRQMLRLILSDAGSGEVLFSTEGPVAVQTRARYQYDKVLGGAPLRLSMNISEAWVDDVTKRETADIIHSQIFENNSYIWVNEVLDWSGGDNYAIRKIHPGLPDTEGSFLSTKTTDIKGRTPYLTELEGIRDHGELFFQYHFKRKESDEVSEKLAYAVLYPDYNWIVAMGIHMDDIDYYVREVEKSSEDLNRHVLAVSSMILLAFFLFAAFFLAVSWRRFMEFKSRSLRKESNIDPLTGALNRRMGVDYFIGAFRHFRQRGLSPVIFSVDIDDFKKVNDTWVHRVGDEVLKAVVERIKRTMRDSE